MTEELVPWTPQTQVPFVYALADPLEPKHVRYVGMAGVRATRPLDHMRRAHKSNRQPHLFYWIRKLHSEGRGPVITILENLHEGSSRDLLGFVESCYVKSLREIGHKLTNLTDGGDGSTGPKSELHRLRIGLGNLGRQTSEDTRILQRKARKQYFESGANRNRVRDSHIRRLHDTGSGKLNESQVIAIRADARGQDVIAVDYNISGCEVSKIKARLKWAHLDGPPSVYIGMARGVANGANKLSDEQVIAIRSDNRSQCVIAQEYGVSQGTISNIKLRKRWSWLQPEIKKGEE